MDDEKRYMETPGRKMDGPERYFMPGDDEIFDPAKFTLIFIDSDSVTNVTSLNRVNKRRVLIFIGNGEGLISFGKGKSDDYESAFDNAFKKMRNNLVCLSLSHTHTTPGTLTGRHNDFRIKLWSQWQAHYYGNPTIWHMLLNTGLHNSRFTCWSRNREPYSMIYGYFIAVTQNTTLEEIARTQGKKPFVHAYVNRSVNPFNYNSWEAKTEHRPATSHY